MATTSSFITFVLLFNFYAVDALKCGLVVCPLYATCEQNHVCVCPDVDDFEKKYEPVCGSNGFTYNNEIELKEYACNNNQNLFVVKPGKCPQQYKCFSPKCHPETICNVTTGKCECPAYDKSVYEPVCGTDGSDYNSKEELRYKACLGKTNVKVAIYDTCSSRVASTADNSPSNTESVNVVVPVVVCLVVMVTVGIAAWFVYHRRNRSSFNVSKGNMDGLLG